MASRTIVFGTQTAFATVSNLNSLAAAAAKPLGKVDFSAVLALNAKVNLEIALASSGVSSAGTLSVYLIESMDDADYTDGIDLTGTSDIAASIKNARLLAVLVANANSQVVKACLDVVGAGFPPIRVLPKYWGLVVLNNTGNTLAASGHDCDYSAVTEAIA